MLGNGYKKLRAMLYIDHSFLHFLSETVTYNISNQLTVFNLTSLFDMKLQIHSYISNYKLMQEWKQLPTKLSEPQP